MVQIQIYTKEFLRDRDLIDELKRYGVDAAYPYSTILTDDIVTTQRDIADIFERHGYELVTRSEGWYLAKRDN